MKVLVIVDEKPITDAITISFLVEWPGTEIVPVTTGQAGIEKARNEEPDIIIFDTELEDNSGFYTLRDLRIISPSPIIILTASMGENDIIRCLDLGADDFIIKPFSKMELVARVKTLLKKVPPANRKSSLVQGRLRYDASINTFYWGKAVLHLTDTESEILYSLMKDAGRVVRYATLSESLWNNGGDHDSPGSLKVHVHHLRQKLKESSADAPVCPTIQAWSRLGYSLEIPK